MTGFVASQEIFSLKKSYDSQVFIEGTDQVSIKQGMQLALSSLLVNLSGNSKIVNEKSIRVMMDAPEKYITQYKLGTEDKKIYASFIFEGDLIRSYLSENELPLWLSNDNLILSYLPCKEETKPRQARTNEQVLALVVLEDQAMGTRPDCHRGRHFASACRTPTCFHDSGGLAAGDQAP